MKRFYGNNYSLFKCYICLFTCATTRNVHLELTSSIIAGHLISCLKRFAGRQGKIYLFIGDKFQTFVSDELNNFLSSNDINWKYILFPWWGGFYKCLTLKDPFISESCIEIKIKLNFYFHTSLWCLKRFYEGLKGLHKTF